MYSENRPRDVALFVKATLTNQLAKYAHPLYLKLGNRSGRGAKSESPEETARYFRQCIDDYVAQLRDVAPKTGGGGQTNFFAGKKVLEYGPGDTLGVALLLYAHGAELVHCVDRFPIHTLSPTNLPIYRAILEGLSGAQKERAEGAFRVKGDPSSGLDEAKIEYRVTDDGLSGRSSEYDIVISRSVLALVNRLDKTVQDVANALKPNGLSIHKVDLSSHGLDRYRPLDFLTWPDALYQMMYSRKGRPNRWRVDKYKELAKSTGLRIVKLTPTSQVKAEDVERVRSKLPKRLRDVPPDELAWLGFWMVLEPSR